MALYRGPARSSCRPQGGCVRTNQSREGAVRAVPLRVRRRAPGNLRRPRAVGPDQFWRGWKEGLVTEQQAKLPRYRVAGAVLRLLSPAWCEVLADPGILGWGLHEAFGEYIELQAHVDHGVGL